MKRTPEEKLLDPSPGGKIAEARDYGIDLTLLAGNLRITPAERLRANDRAVNDLLKFETAMHAARKANKVKSK